MFDFFVIFIGGGATSAAEEGCQSLFTIFIFSPMVPGKYHQLQIRMSNTVSARPVLSICYFWRKTLLQSPSLSANEYKKTNIWRYPNILIFAALCKSARLAMLSIWYCLAKLPANTRNLPECNIIAATKLKHVWTQYDDFNLYCNYNIEHDEIIWIFLFYCLQDIPRLFEK